MHLKKWHFNIEAAIKELGKIKGSFSIGLLDCCRAKLPSADLRPAIVDKKSKGIAGAKEQEDQEWNCCIINFACPAGKIANANSTFTTRYFKQIHNRMVSDRYISFPEVLQGFTTDNGGDSSAIVTHRLLLQNAECSQNHPNELIKEIMRIKEHDQDAEEHKAELQEERKADPQAYFNQKCSIGELTDDDQTWAMEALPDLYFDHMISENSTTRLFQDFFMERDPLAYM